jgi:hypothetical protein
MDEKLLEGFIEEIRSDNDFAILVFYCFGAGIRKIQDEIEEGRNDEITQALERYKKRRGWRKYRTTIH